MPSSRLYELLAEGYAKPSSAFSAFQGLAKAGVDLTGAVKGYQDVKRNNTRLADMLGDPSYGDLRLGQLDDRTLALMKLKAENVPQPIYGVAMDKQGGFSVNQIGTAPKGARVVDQSVMPTTIPLYKDTGEKIADVPGNAKVVPTDKPTAPKTPDDYRFNAAGALEPIPGGPADQKAKEEAAKKEARKEAMKARGRMVSDAIDRALANVTPMSAGLGGAVMGNVAGSRATDLAADIQTIQANLSFDKLAEIRENSKTGGGLGAISDKELGLLGSTAGNLNPRQHHTTLRKRLKLVKEYNDKINGVGSHDASKPDVEGPGAGINRTSDSGSVNTGATGGTNDPTTEDAAALAWAEANPNNPLSAPIRAKARTKLQGR